jgi:hypothetical protein
MRHREVREQVDEDKQAAFLKVVLVISFPLTFLPLSLYVDTCFHVTLELLK